MSHTILVENRAPVILVQLTVVNYVNGGEVVQATEIDGTFTSGVNIFFAQCPPGSNSLGAVIFPVLLAGSNIRLYRPTAGGFAEIPTTNGLNAVIAAMALEPIQQ